MLSFTHNSQHYEFHGHACIKRYTGILLDETTGACSGLERTFFSALIRRHPSAHLLTQGVKEIRVQDNQLYVVNQDGASMLVSLAHCYAGENTNALLNAMRMAVATTDEDGACDASTTVVDPLCCAFIENQEDDDLPRLFETNRDGLTSFKFGEDLSFIAAWRAYYDEEIKKNKKKTTATAVSTTTECPGEWLNARGWCSGRRNRNPSYSRTVNQKTLIVCKHQQQWVFIYGGTRMDALATDSPKEAMKAAYQYCRSHNLLF